jgi:hypothetical protein
MILKPGVRPYEPREDRTPLLVRVKNTGQVGVVRRATPRGRGFGPQAYVVFYDGENEYEWTGHWYPQSELQRVSTK